MNGIFKVQRYIVNSFNYAKKHIYILYTRSNFYEVKTTQP